MKGTLANDNYSFYSILANNLIFFSSIITTIVILLIWIYLLF